MKIELEIPDETNVEHKIFIMFSKFELKKFRSAMNYWRKKLDLSRRKYHKNKYGEEPDTVEKKIKFKCIGVGEKVDTSEFLDFLDFIESVVN